MKILLTGAAGRLGSAACRVLCAAGFEVRATDVVYRQDLPIKMEVANLLDSLACYRLLDGVDAAVHLANHPSPFGRSPQDLFHNNVMMNVNIFEAAQQVGVKTIIFASSIQAASTGRPISPDSVTGFAYLPADGDLPANPGNIYALSKHVGENTLKYYTQQHALNGTAIRFPMLLNDNQVRPITQSIRPEEKVFKIKEGFLCLSYSDAADLLSAILKSNLQGFRIYLPSVTEPTVDMAVPDLIANYYKGVPLKKPVEQIASLVDISLITQQTGWSPHRRLYTAAP